MKSFWQHISDLAMMSLPKTITKFNCELCIFYLMISLHMTQQSYQDSFCVADLVLLQCYYVLMYSSGGPEPKFNPTLRVDLRTPNNTFLTTVGLVSLHVGTYAKEEHAD